MEMDDNNMEIYQQQQQEDLTFDNLVLRRADPDDCDQIINLVELGKDDVYNRVYSYPKILKLIETSYLAITVLDRDGRVVAFAAFEDYPQGMRGMYDERHYNAWEAWFKQAYQVEEFSAFNTLWLTYFISGGSIAYKDQKFAFKKILQTVYTSLPDIIGILFLMRGDADPDDINYCFDSIRDFFEEMECKRREVLKDVRGIHFQSKVHFSSRVLVLPFIEVRVAQQEDHDDLADVFNSQSETVTEAYGEYFIAELIAAQNENNKALVAQVKDKAVGLMGLTNEVDVKLLHQCFELDPFDNLLKPEFMNAVRKRREVILEDRRKIAEEQRLYELKRLKEETMRCNIISQRIALQEFLQTKTQDINAYIDNLLNGEDESYKSLDRKGVEEMLGSWLGGFEISQPSDYFNQHPTDDYELVCNIQSEQEFLMSTLEIFGLPKNYLAGNGHFADWKNRNKDDKLAAAKKRAAANKSKAKKTNQLLKKKMEDRKGPKEDEDKPPSHFDIEPFKNAFKNFIICDGAARSKMRIELKYNFKTVNDVFVDEHKEHSFKKCVDIKELGKLLQQKNLFLPPAVQENIGSMLICFGDISFEVNEVERMPEETLEEKRAKEIARMKEEQEKELEKGGDDKKKKKAEEKKKKEEEEKKKKEEGESTKKHGEEEKKEEKKKEPPKPIKVLLFQTSIHDLLISLDKMADYDFILYQLGVMKADISDELQRLNPGQDRPNTDFSRTDLQHQQSNQGSQSGSRIISPLASVRDSNQQLQKEASTKVAAAAWKYSPDPQYEEIVTALEDLDTIPEAPDYAKNAFAITLFCMEAAFESRSKDMLKYAFDLFQDRDYLIVTQPHTVAENSLLQKFTLVEKKPQNTFSHVLYLIHRDALFEQDLYVERVIKDDLGKISSLLDILDNKQEVLAAITETAQNPASPNLSFVAKIEQEVIGAFLIAKDINLEYYRSHFHIQDSILLSEHERKGHTRLIYFVMNPIFETATRYILKELLRLSANTCMYFEIHDKTVIPDIFHQLVHVRSRRFPHFLDRKWDHERYIPDDQENQKDEEKAQINGAERDHLDEIEGQFALCFTTKRLLSEPKIVKNSRIVVVGASDTGISFIEALLSISYLNFTNIVLIAPGGLPHHHFDKKSSNLKAYSTSYTQQELKKLLLENRVRVINALMVDIDRGDKNVILHDQTVIPYDTLILAMGIQDKTLNSLGYVSRGIVPKDKKRIEGLLSIDDPFLYNHLRSGGTLMSMLTNRKAPQNCVVYGRTLNAYACLQGLIARGMKSEQLTLVIPRDNCHVEESYDEVEEMNKDIPIINPPAFDDSYTEEKMHKMIESMGIKIVRNGLLMQLYEDEQNQLQTALFKLLDIPDEEEEEDDIEGIDQKSAGMDSKMSGQLPGEGESMEGDLDKSQEEHVTLKKKRKKNELEIDCRVLITAGHRDVDADVFSAIHTNGLVYNGRLIVDKNFQTTDPSIFAAGSLCEFSGRYKALSQGKPLRMDRYNGREMGSRLARSVFDIYDPQLAAPGEGSLDEELPSFYLPQGSGAVLPNGVIYYHIKTTNPLILGTSYEKRHKEVKNRDDLRCDNLNIQTGKGHFIKFSFNSIGLIDSVTYMGGEEIILQSLWSFVGLHENYLNSLTARHEKGIIPNAVEFLSENWAIALYHEWFGDFCLRMRQGIQGMRDVQLVLEKAFDMTKKGQGINRSQFDDLKKHIDAKTLKMVEDETLEFIKVNMNHLPMYYIPGEEFQ